jgi:hypothetical protein
VLVAGISIGITATAAIGTTAALAAQDENWAARFIAETQRQDAERLPRGRRGAVERMGSPMIEEDDIEPRRKSRRADRTEDYDESTRPRARKTNRRKLASLGREVPRDFAAPAGSETQPAKNEAREEKRDKKLGVMVASLGREFVTPPKPAEQPSLTGGPIAWVASSGCLASPLRTVLAQLAANFGPVRVNSTCRSRRHNARVGGAKRSYHLTGHAADFRIVANVRSVIAFLRGNRSVGGLKHYGFGLFHIDTGPRRSW